MIKVYANAVGTVQDEMLSERVKKNKEVVAIFFKYAIAKSSSSRNRASYGSRYRGEFFSFSRN